LILPPGQAATGSVLSPDIKVSQATLFLPNLSMKKLFTVFFHILNSSLNITFLCCGNNWK